MYYGLVRLAAAVPQLRVADCHYNVKEIARLVEQAEREQVQVLCFPELCITGYTCGDLFFQSYLQQQACNALATLQQQTQNNSVAIVVGMPLYVGNRLFNTAVVLQNGRILGAVPKTNMPNNNEFYEKRWFASSRTAVDIAQVTINGETVPFGTNLLFSDGAFSFAIEICEDLWMPIPPSAQHVLHGADVVLNLSASSELVAKSAYRHQMIEVHSARCMAGYLYVSCGVSESTSNLVFGGDACIAENGHILCQSERFAQSSQLLIGEIDIEALRHERSRNTNFDDEKSVLPYSTIAINEARYKEFPLRRKVNKHPFVPAGKQCDENCNEIFAIQTAGLAKRWKHTAAKSMIVGVSGGLDSTLALLVCVKTADLLGYQRQQVIAVTMPGFGTTDRTYTNAVALAQSLGVTLKEISIKAACLQHFKDIEHSPTLHNVVYENAQARERMQILMDIANQTNGLVVGTGDMSELALGWSTYNGDHISMYGVNAGVPKTLIRHLIAWLAEQMSDADKTILHDILATPISPELLPADTAGAIAQKTEDIVGPYELHDFFLFHFIRNGCSPAKIIFLAQQAFADQYTDDVIKRWLKVFMQRFFAQQFKRSCLPDAPRVGTVSLTPGDWRMPSDAVAFTV
ncbi:NAD(+) synthase [Bacteroidia bacterium]|nr:NAD(+) synthase [Bacteroidia bacterium]